MTDELSKVLECIYFGDTCDGNSDIKTCNINFTLSDFNGQAAIPTEII